MNLLGSTGERVSLLTPRCGLGTHNKDITSTKYDDETSNKPMQFGRGRLAGRAAQGDSYNSLTVVRSSTVLYESTKKTGDAGYEDPIQRKEKARPRAILSMQASQSQPEPAVKSSRVSHARIMCDRGNSPQGPRACVNLTVAGWHRGVAYSVDGISVRSTSYSTEYALGYPATTAQGSGSELALGSGSTSQALLVRSTAHASLPD